MLSRTSGNAWALPTSACDTDLASRCDCICAWPLAPTWAELRPALFNASAVVRIRPINPRVPMPIRIRRCSAGGRIPISGRPLPSLSEPGARSCWRVSGNSVISDGAASVMIDESKFAPWG